MCEILRKRMYNALAEWLPPEPTGLHYPGHLKTKKKYSLCQVKLNNKFGFKFVIISIR